MPTMRNRTQGACQRRLIKTLAQIPGMAFSLGPRLQITSRQIKSDGVAINTSQGIFFRNIGAPCLQCHNHLDFVMQLARLWRINDRKSSLATEQSIRRLHEEKWRFPTVGLLRCAHFAGMLGIVAANTKYPPQREARRRPLHRHTGRHWRNNDVIAHTGLSRSTNSASRPKVLRRYCASAATP